MLREACRCGVETRRYPTSSAREVRRRRNNQHGRVVEAQSGGGSRAALPRLARRVGRHVQPARRRRGAGLRPQERGGHRNAGGRPPLPGGLGGALCCAAGPLCVLFEAWPHCAPAMLAQPGRCRDLPAQQQLHPPALVRAEAAPTVVASSVLLPAAHARAINVHSQ